MASDFNCETGGKTGSECKQKEALLLTIYKKRFLFKVSIKINHIFISNNT